MLKSVKEKVITREQLVHLAHQTCQWWSAVFIQAERFLTAMESNNGRLPWEEGSTILIPERMFLITALHHAIEGLQKLDIELQRINDFSLQPVLEAVEKVVSVQDLVTLRNMNEHNLDYMIGEGNRQEKYETVLQAGDYKVATNAAWTVMIGSENVFSLGDVRIDQVLEVMKEQKQVVFHKAQEIVEEVKCSL